MVQKIILLTVFLSIGLPTYAGDTGKLAGKIIDAETKEPLPGANIIVKARWESDKEVPVDPSFGAATDVDGEYFILNIRPGLYTIEISFVGYQTQHFTRVEINTDKTTRLDVALESAPLKTDEIEVVAYRPTEVEKDLTATKHTYNIQEVKQIVGIVDAGDILQLQADVSDGHFRGGRSGEAKYLVGGVSIVNPLDNSLAFEPMITALDQVEVYTSGFSAEYGNVQSGIINMVTKEASSNWHTRLEYSTTNAYYKTFGGSVYDKQNLYFFEMLNNTDEWLDGRDPKSGKILWTHFGLLFPENYGPIQKISWPMPPPPSRADSLRVANLMRVFWLQSMQDVGLKYAKPDYRFDFATGGPLSKKVSIFFAGRQNIIQPLLPPTNPNMERQVMSNLVFRPSNTHKIKLNFNYNYSFNQIFSSNYRKWFERIFQLTYQNKKAFQCGLNWEWVYSPATFLNFKLNYLSINNDSHVNLLGDTLLADLYTDYSNWRFYTTPTGHTIGKFNTDRGYNKTQTYNFQFSVLSQINKSNLIKSGLQFNYYDILVDREMGFTNSSSIQREKYNVFPYEGAFYIQDKMEFQGFIANVGFRFDFYNMNVNYYSDKFSPYRNPDFDPKNLANGGYIAQELAAKEKTKLNVVFQPRLGFSFPISEKTVLHVNYGVFTQRPAFQYVFVHRSKLNTNPDYIRLGNPRLKPESTISYDIGLVHVLPWGFQINISAYLKDVNNLVQHAVYTDSLGYSYETFDNREYADIKGFHVSLEKKYGNISGYIRYNMQYATGKSPSAIGSSVRAKYYENNPSSNELPSPEDIYLDFDRRHILLVNLAMHTPSAWNWQVLGFHPLKNVLISTIYRFQSGRPFTWDPSGKGLRFNQRTPNEQDLRIRLQKRININEVSIKVYADAFNVLNQEVFYYSRLFDENKENPYIKIYMEDRSNVFIDPEYAPYTTGLKGYLIGNKPRHYRFGIIFEF